MSNRATQLFVHGPDHQEIAVGAVVASKCGHDEGRIYLVLSMEDDFLFLCDGEKKDPSKPKRKRRKHVQALGQLQNAQDWLFTIGQMPVDQQKAAIRKMICEYMNEQMKSDT